MLLLSGLAACSSGATPKSADIGSSCVLYARATSTIDLRGDAYTWWDGAAGRYLRGPEPEPGSILVLSRTDRLQLGHLAVVRRVMDPRDILVDHSNWVRGEIITGMAVRDVSPDNDWTELRFLNAGSNVFGAIYPAYGFIYPAVPVPMNTGALSGQPQPKVAAQ